MTSLFKPRLNGARSDGALNRQDSESKFTISSLNSSARSSESVSSSSSEVRPASPIFEDDEPDQPEEQNSFDYESTSETEL